VRGDIHHETLLIPFGIGDARVGFATVALADLRDGPDPSASASEVRTKFLM